MSKLENKTTSSEAAQTLNQNFKRWPNLQNPSFQHLENELNCEEKNKKKTSVNNLKIKENQYNFQSTNY